MIAKLTGIVDALSEDGVVIDVGGVGYSVFCSTRTLGALPSVNEPATVLVETHVREDHIHLFGFATATERDWFRLLLTVQGVGAKVALAVLSAFPADELALAIVAEDVATLTRANGVGRKVAQRIAAELRDKAGAVAIGGAAVLAGVAGTPAGAPADAVSALVNLGYRQIEATGAIGHAVKSLGSDANAETLIKAGLQELAS